MRLKRSDLEGYEDITLQEYYATSSNSYQQVMHYQRHIFRL